MLERNALAEKVKETGIRGEELHLYLEKTTDHYVDQDYELTAVCMRNVLAIIMEEERS